MSAHVLLTLLNELGRSVKMLGLTSISLLFQNMLKKFNNTGATMVDSVYHMTLNLLCNHVVEVKMLKFCHISVYNIVVVVIK